MVRRGLKREKHRREESLVCLGPLLPTFPAEVSPAVDQLFLAEAPSIGPREKVGVA